MTYATVDDFLARVPLSEAVRLTNQDDPAATEPDLGEISRVLGDAANAIDGYLRAAGYDLAVLATYPPPELKRPQVELARYYLNPYHEEGDPTKAGYDSAIDWLKSLVKGDVRLALPEADGTTTPLTPRVRFKPGRQYWNSDFIDSLR